MTIYAPTHPVGPSMIYEKCGEDGTEAYSKFHDRSLLMLVQDSIVGSFDPGADPPTAAPSDTACPTMSRQVMVDAVALAAHNTSEDCWVVYYGTGKAIFATHVCVCSKKMCLTYQCLSSSLLFCSI
jgi:cytochrome b involved in lipid metabolism